MAIVGIDEVGRGAWAGPLVVGAVLLGGITIDGLTDSKKLSKKQREILNLEIRQRAVAIGLGWVSAKDIDRIGLSQALKLASRRALAHIRGDYHEIIIDGTMRLIDDPRVTLMKKADLLVPSVSAASIVAKVARDNYMKHLDKIFPGYRFTGHVGYGTAAHRAAINTLGVTPLHRLSYAPLVRYGSVTNDDISASKQAQSNSISIRPKSSRSFSLIAKYLQPEREPTRGSGLTPGAKPFGYKRRGEGDQVSTKQIGDNAENEVAHYLVRLGHKILDRNWKTKYCEIDIISTKDDTLYFTEVKYRKTNLQGSGIEAITIKKQRQMSFAAEYYATRNDISHSILQLAVADVTGEPPEVIKFIELIL